MPLVEKISQMQKQGLKEGEIMQKLREEGISPREINEALEQSKVKSAVSNSDDIPSLIESSPRRNRPGEFFGQEISGQLMPEMQVKETRFPTNAPPMQQQMPPSTQETMPPPIQEVPEEMPEEMQFEPPPQIQEAGTGEFREEAYPPTYPEYEYPEQAIDTDIMTEVAEQIIYEKTEKLQQQISELLGFKVETEGRVSNIHERLRRIEMMIDKLQTSILGEIGNYGKNISDLKDEMIATQDSFSKILTPLSENMEKLKKISKSSPKTTKTKIVTKEKKEKKKPKRKTKKDTFENYLRS